MIRKRVIKNIALALLTINIGGALSCPIHAEPHKEANQSSTVNPQVEDENRARAIAYLENKIKILLMRGYSFKFNKNELILWKKDIDIKRTITYYENEYNRTRRELNYYINLLYQVVDHGPKIPTRQDFRKATIERLKPEISRRLCCFNYMLDVKRNSLKKSGPGFVPPPKNPVQLSQEYIVE